MSGIILGKLLRIVLLGTILFVVYHIIDYIRIEIDKIKKSQNSKEKFKHFMYIAILPVLIIATLVPFIYLSFVVTPSSVQTSVISGYEYTSDNYVAHQKVNDYFFTELEDVYWSKIPESQKQILKNDWYIIFDTTTPKGMDAKYSVQLDNYDMSNTNFIGSALAAKRLIYVDLAVDKDVLINTYIHEHGHAIAYELGSLQGSLEWLSLYHEYKDEVNIDDYFLRNSDEFFAYYYAEYFLNGEELQETVPEIYNYMDRVNNMEINNNVIARTITGIKGLLHTIFVCFS